MTAAPRTRPTGKLALAIGFAACSSLTSFMSGATKAAVTTMTVVRDGVVQETHRYFELYGAILMALGLVGALVAASAAIAMWRGRFVAARRLLIVSGIGGLFPGLLPGGLSLVSLYLLSEWQREDSSGRS